MNIIGWSPIIKPPPGSVVTQAFILCSQCRNVIDTVGGIKSTAWCPDCVRKYLKEETES